MKHSSGRYSKYLRFINISAHIILLNLMLYLFDKSVLFNFYHLAYINLSWLIIAFSSNFYATYRFTDFIKLMTRLVVQYTIFVLAYVSFYALTQQTFNIETQSKVLITFLVGLFCTRLFFYSALRLYRIKGGNFRRVIIVGYSNNEEKLKEFFNNKKEYGYKLQGIFCNKELKEPFLKGSVDKAFQFVKDNNIDEIYCSINDLSKDEIKQFIRFSDENYKTLKFIPNSNDLFINETQVEHYDYIPIIALRKNPLLKPFEKTIKRVFDILFSISIIIFVLSWITPLLWILIKLESKGSLLFKQKREGLNGKRFNCYKFRSMYRNKFEDLIQTTKNDNRITIIGKFIRKTSIDELPQFFNVFLGNMSVVGPRPHMLSQGEKYKELVNKYAVRHFVKPGITGLAQVKGFRGEIDSKAAIKYRVKFDLFYIENWSFLLDLKIILQTIFNALKGEEKAY